jgi:hypothetical protein
MPLNLAKPTGLGLDDVKDLFTEAFDHLLGVDRPTAEIFLDPVK